jgi:TPR repeat protein
MEPHIHARLQYLDEAGGPGTSGDCPVNDDRPISFRFTIALVLLIFCLAVPAWAEYRVDKEAYDLAIEHGDYATAMRVVRPLAEQGLAAAQFNLGLLYANGQGVPKDDAQARQWYEKAAAQGHSEAQVNLGILLVYGRGVTQDYKIAAYWLRLSANQGNDLAQRKLGLMYERGDGVQQDYVRAYMWYSLGAAKGVEAGARLRDAIAKRMDPDQIAEAQQLAREWKPKGK